jgi:DUF4097 and DUF4098 domain-containing protein YvlB
MKNFSRSLLVGALALCATAAIAATNPAATTPAATADQRVTVPLSDPARPGALHVSLVHGSITVKGSSRKDVLVEVRPRGDDDSEQKSAQAGGLRRIAQPTAFTVEEENNRVEVSANDPRRGCDVFIEVPARIDLQLSTVNAGDIQVEGVEGELEISNVNGAITLTRVGGSVLAHTTNGAVNVALTRVTPGKPMAFTTLNGAVDVSLPASTKANLRLRSDNGQLFTDFDFTQQAVEMKETHEPNGRTMKEIGKVIGGSINGGGPEFELRSFNGNVYVRKAGS